MELIQQFKINPVLAAGFLIITLLSMWLLTTSFYLFAVLPILALWLLFILGTHPEVGFFIIIFMVPLDILREITESGTSLMSISKVIGIYLIAIYIFYLLLNKLKMEQLRSNLWPPIFFLTISVIISTILSPYQLASFDDLRQFATSLVIFILTMLVLSEETFFKKLPYVIMAGIACSVALEIVGFFFNLPLFFLASELKRGVGGMQDPNFMASMILFSVPFIINMTSKMKTTSGVISGIFFLLALATGLVLTYSRSAFMVASLLGILLIWEYKRYLKPKFTGFIIMGIILTCTVGVVLVPASYWERQKNISTQDSSISSRLSYLIVGWESFKKHPIIGTGIGTFPTIYADSRYAFSQSYRKTRTQTMRAAHNSYLEILVCTGIAGFIPFLLLIWTTAANFRKAASICLEKGLLSEASLINSYKLAFYSVLLFFFFLSDPYIKYFWLCVGCSFFALQLAHKMRPIAGLK